ncbi:MAG: choice-of-anchor B family protein [Bacteroidia bacterium]|nr:choice-of-anchor B family protein [Bacteroidia bacterium]
MKTFFLFLVLWTVLFLNNPAQTSQNLTLKANWQDQNLPIHAGLIYNDVWGFVYGYREYAILGSAGQTHFIEVTDPASPVEVARFAGAVNSIWRDFKTFSHYAYGSADETSQTSPSGLQIFDYSGLPNSVSKVYDSPIFFERAHNIYIDEKSGRLYAAGTDTRPNGLIVLDLNADPANPNLLASVNLPGGYVHDVHVRNNIAYCSHGFNGMYIYDMTNPTNPILIGNITSYPNQGYNHSSWLTDDGNFLVFADESFGRPLRILDITDLNNLSIVSTFKSHLVGPSATNSMAHNPFVRNGYAFIAYYQDGIQIFDINDVLEPRQIAWYDTDTTNIAYTGYDGAWGVYPFLPSHNILGSDQTFGLFILEFDDLKPAIGNTQPDFPFDETQITNLAKPIRLFPNPVNEGENLHLTLENDSLRILRSVIYDLNGKEVRKTSLVYESGDYPVDISGIPPGIYAMIITGENFYARKKLVIR